MSRDLESLVVNPLYYDLLSGEFTPLSDPKNRAHTMARLAVATYTKGREDDRDDGDDFIGLDYVPSWAENVTSRVMLVPGKDDRNTLVGVSLAIENSYNFIDFDFKPDGYRGLQRPELRITHENEDNTEFYPVELGSTLSSLRQRVATYANNVLFRANSEK